MLKKITKPVVAVCGIFLFFLAITALDTNRDIFSVISLTQPVQIANAATDTGGGSMWQNLWNNFISGIKKILTGNSSNSSSQQATSGGNLAPNPGTAVSQSQPTDKEGFWSGFAKKVKDIGGFFNPFKQEVYNKTGGKEVKMPEQKQQQPQQQGGENGTPGSPYKLEANQFKKMCGQNTYILYWRKGGKNGRDMAQPASGAGSGKDQGARNTWELPSCGELAECHCCCNTCKIPETECKQDGWVFAKKGCVIGCSPTCDGNCKPTCQKWDKPEGPGDPTLNRDCKCNMEGCPKSNSSNCEIIIMDKGNTELQYTKLDGNKEQYFLGAGEVKFKNGNGEKSGSPEVKSKIKSDANDVKDKGWIKKLKDEKGKCCKCYQDGPPIQ